MHTYIYTCSAVSIESAPSKSAFAPPPHASPVGDHQRRRPPVARRLSTDDVPKSESPKPPSLRRVSSGGESPKPGLLRLSSLPESDCPVSRTRSNDASRSLPRVVQHIAVSRGSSASSHGAAPMELCRRSPSPASSTCTGYRPPGHDVSSSPVSNGSPGTKEDVVNTRSSSPGVALWTDGQTVTRHDAGARYSAQSRVDEWLQVNRRAEIPS